VALLIFRIMDSYRASMLPQSLAAAQARFP